MACFRAKAVGTSLQLYFETFLSEYGKVKEEILASTRKLATDPELHPPDKYRKENDGSFRAYELHRYRIAYRVNEKQVVVVRARHTSMEPLYY